MATLLTGCNDLNSQFTCPKQPGVSCQSLDQVNTLIDQGKIASTQSEKPAKISTQPAVISVNQHVVEQDTLLSSQLRTSDHVMRLWIAPYIDAQGNYFSANVVYHVIDHGQWVGESIDDIRAVKSSDRIITTREKDHV